LRPGLKFMEEKSLILLTGATGYIGGRVLKVLEQKQYRMRCLARHPEFLKSHIGDSTEVVAGDLLQPETLGPAMRGVESAFYLVHSMGGDGSFEDNDRLAARNFADAAHAAGVRRIIYLGGLGDNEDELSPHLRSRQEVGEILRASRIPVIEFRASIVIGSGSLSFEMIRALVERLPVMVIPRWALMTAQPIAVTNVIEYLVAALEIPIAESRIFEIGGCDKVSYRHIMREYARQRGLHRFMIPVPVLTPHLSSLWLALVTPIYARIGRKLIDSIRNSTVVRDTSVLEVFNIRPMGISDAIGAALRNEESEFAETRWSDALSSSGPARQWGGTRFGNRLVDVRAANVGLSPERAFAPIRRIGGKNGWYYANSLWHLRGWIDLIVGGIGMRRGRRDPERLRIGDPVDCWRVEAFEPDRRLLLSAEMTVPGRAWLEFEVKAAENGCRITQTAIFDPVGLMGLAYWYLVYPLHQLVFAGMLRGIARTAKAAAVNHGLSHADTAASG
jgi:uncharacterized protein YbjT (DUF2867 family)